ncbi:hypothetical protein FQA39_LY12605 [Lamprigera yunnana]|nr:hypothetical protein FQA39_LY12605 [Lamprigera yunnana]
MYTVCELKPLGLIKKKLLLNKKAFGILRTFTLRPIGEKYLGRLNDEEKKLLSTIKLGTISVRDDNFEKVGSCVKQYESAGKPIIVEKNVACSPGLVTLK